MKADHLNRGVAERFVEGELPSEDARRIERHLSICSDCRDLADQVSLLAKLQVLDSWLHPGYDEAFERAAVGAADRLEVLLIESRSTEELLSELLLETTQVRRFRIRNEERFHSLKLCQLLQAQSRKGWFSDSTAALELADLAVLVAQHLDTGQYGSSLVEDCRALSLAYLGNAFRITSDLWRAEQALMQAWIHHTQAGADLFTEAEILRLFSSLRCHQCRLDEATRFSDRASAIYHEGQDCHLEGATLIQKGLALGYDNRFQEGIQVLQAGLARIDADEEPQLLLRGRHNLICFLSRGGAPEKARTLLGRNRFLYYELGDRIMLAKLRWLDGQIAWALGQYAEAEDILCEARDVFLGCRVGCEVFSISLEMAEMYAQSRQRQKAIKVLEEVIPLGEAIGFGRDAFLAKLLYEQVSRA